MSRVYGALQQLVDDAGQQAAAVHSLCPSRLAKVAAETVSTQVPGYCTVQLV
jgi:hypothetical protein|eukprot:COSAG06_NODE_743_length_12657_cov_470.745023_2_plen_52_part_00